MSLQEWRHKYMTHKVSSERVLDTSVFLAGLSLHTLYVLHTNLVCAVSMSLGPPQKAKRDCVSWIMDRLPIVSDCNDALVAESPR